MSYIKGISPSYCTHKILMEDDYKPVIQPQRRLNPKVQDVVKNKIVVLLDSGLFYPVSDSSWVSPIHVVPKKGGITVVLNDNNELILSRTVTRWRVILPNPDRTRRSRKDNIHLPTNAFAYRRMPFGLCNAPATFQRCMTAIFHDMVEDFMEVFMDEFLVFGAENLAADHLSRLENPDLGIFTKEKIADKFLGEHLMILKTKLNEDKPCIFKDAKDYVMRCDACQRSGNISSISEMPQNNIQVESQALPTNNARIVIKFLRRLFERFGVPKALISDRGTHFCNSQLEKALPKLVGYNLNNWSKKLDDALWAFRTAYKTPTGCTPFRLVYGNACHLHVEIEHKAYWALKQCKMDLTAAAKNHFMELNELMESRDGAYENTRIYKERTKR
ncbi:reverse transcriptase domain-containing protein [Tanacetum coccineum]